MESEGEWKPTPITDAAVREWMKAQGLPVGSTRYYIDEEVYAWRHETTGGSPTLWIARPVLEANDPAALVAALDRLGMANRMRAAPKARFLIVQEGTHVQVRPWGHGPDRSE
jgi:hypothetical protein